LAKDLTQGPLASQIVRLAIPGLLSLLGITVNHFVDGIWVGRLGPEALAAITPSSFIVWILYSIVDIMPIGLVAIISRYYGEKNLTQASETSQKVIQLVFFISIILSVCGWLFAKNAMELVGVSAEVVRLGSIYLMIISTCLPAIFLVETYSSIFRAVGDTIVPMRLILTAIIANIILDPLLIFGIGPFPEMGIAGAALATAIGYYLSLGLAFVELNRGKLPFKIIKARPLPFDFPLLWRIAKIGLPISISGIGFSIVYLALVRIAAPFGDYVVASFRVGQFIEAVSFMICFGFGQATASMIGQNLGAKLTDRAEKSAQTAIGIVSGITIAFSFIFFFAAKPLVSIFSSDIQVATAAALYLKIIAISQLFMGLEIVYEGAFSGAGDTLPPMLISIIGTTLRIPLAIIFVGPLNWGYQGMYWAITISTVLKGVSIFIWFKLGRWKLKQV